MPNVERKVQAQAQFDAPPAAATPKAAFRGSWKLTKSLIAYAPGRMVLAALLLLLAGVTEAFGILMLIPLLHIVGLDEQQADGNPVAEVVNRAADAIGVELSLATVLLVFLALAVVRALTSWQRDMLLAKTRLGFIDQVRERLYADMAQAKWEHLLGLRQADILHTVTTSVNRIGSGAFTLLQLAISGLLALMQVAVAVSISPMVTGIALTTGFALLAASHPLTLRTRRLGERLTRANRDIFASSTDFLAGLKLAKSHGAVQAHVEHFGKTLSAARQRQMDHTWVSSTTRVALNLTSAAILVGLVWFSASYAAVTMAELAILALIFARISPMLSGLQGQAQQLANSLPAYEYAESMGEDFQQAAESDRVLRHPAPRIALRTQLALRHVSFAYGKGARVLDDVSMDIPAGKMTVIAGPSGAGKSTLADMLLGLLTPSAGKSGRPGATLSRGQVLIDGAPLTERNLPAWRQSVAYAPQDPFLFHDSIRANLLWARPQASEAELWEALRQSAADAFVAALPRGLDTLVGDRGSWFSGGERQRLALARALLRNPALLLLDEATGQLDSATERRIATALRSLPHSCTVVAIAHRTGLMEVADGIVLIEAGRVAAVGTWRELAPRLKASAEVGLDMRKNACIVAE